MTRVRSPSRRSRRPRRHPVPPRLHPPEDLLLVPWEPRFLSGGGKGNFQVAPSPDEEDVRVSQNSRNPSANSSTRASNCSRCWAVSRSGSIPWTTTSIPSPADACSAQAADGLAGFTGGFGEAASDCLGVAAQNLSEAAWRSRAAIGGAASGGRDFPSDESDEAIRPQTSGGSPATSARFFSLAPNIACCTSASDNPRAWSLLIATIWSTWRRP